MFENKNRIKRSELAEEVQHDLLTPIDREKLDGFIINPDGGGVSFAFSIEMNVNGTIYKFDGTKDVDIDINPETIGAATVDHTHLPQIDITGNSATTTQLKIPVNIGNASFDGTKSITLTDMGVASASHNHDTIYSKINHNHDTIYSKINHNHDDDYSDINHTHLYADSTESGGPATTALKFDKELKLKISGALSGETKFSGDEGEVGLEVELGSHTHTLSDIGFAGNAVIMESTDYEIDAPNDPNAEGEGAKESNFAFHTYTSDEKYIIFELYDIVSEKVKIIPTMFIGGSEAPPDGKKSNGGIDNYILNIEYLDSNYSLIGSETIDENTINQTVPVGTKYIKVISFMLLYLSYTEKDTFYIRFIDANNAPELLTKIYCKENSDEASGKYSMSLYLKSFSIVTDKLIDWTRLFAGCNNLEEVNITINGGKDLIFDGTFYGCTKLKNVQIYQNESTIVSAVEMFKLSGITVPPNSLDYSKIVNMTSMFEGSGIYKFPNNDQFKSNKNKVNLNRTFANCNNLSGEIHIPNIYATKNEKIVPVLDIIDGTLLPITVYHHARMPMIETTKFSNMSRKFAITDGIIFDFDSTLASNVNFSFRCTPLNDTIVLNVMCCLIDTSTGNLTTSTNKSFTIQSADFDMLNTISIESCNFILITNDSLIREFQYSDLSEIKSIEVNGANISRFSVLKRDNDWYPFTQSTGLEYFSMNSEGITNMKRAFYGCSKLESVDINTSNAVDMSSMFENCSSLARFPLLDTSKTTNINRIFSGCSKLLMENARIDIWNNQGDANPMLPISDYIYDTETPIEVAYFSNNVEMDRYVTANKNFITGVIIDEFNVVKSSDESSDGTSIGLSPYYIHLWTDQSHPSNKQLAIGLLQEHSFQDNSICIIGFSCRSGSTNEEVFRYNSKLVYDKDTDIIIDIPSETDFVNIYGNLTTFNILSTNSMIITDIHIEQMPNLSKLNILPIKNILRSFNIGKNNLNTMESMFSSFVSLQSATICIGKNVENLKKMFYKCKKLIDATVYYDNKRYSNQNGIDATSMFDNCTSLTSISLDTSNVTDMNRMFYSCSSLTTIPLLDTHNVTDMSNMFSYCSSLTTIPLLDTSKVTDMVNMFTGSFRLTFIPLLDTSKVTNMWGMFSECSSLTTIPLIDTHNVTEMSNMFNSCSSLTTIPLIDTSNVTDMSYMFENCSSLTSIPLIDTSKVTDMSNMFHECSSLATIPLIDTSNVTDMNRMFYSCSSLTTIPLLDTHNVTDISYMFCECSSLTSIPLLITHNVTDMGGMFESCSSLTSIPFLNTSKVTNMSTMFELCKNLETVPLLITHNVTNMNYMFNGCTSLKELPLFNTEEITSLVRMFNCNFPMDHVLFYICPTEHRSSIKLDLFSGYLGHVIYLYNDNSYDAVVSAQNSKSANNKIHGICVEDAILLKVGNHKAKHDIYASFLDSVSVGDTLTFYRSIIKRDGTVSVDTINTSANTRTIVIPSSIIDADTEYIVLEYNHQDSNGKRVRTEKISLDGPSNKLIFGTYIEEASTLYFPNLSSDFVNKSFANIHTLSVYCNCGSEYFMNYYDDWNSIELRTIKYVNTKNKKDLHRLFAFCRYLNEVPPIDTGSATDLWGMFQDCSSLTNDVPLLDTHNVTDMSNMFSSSVNLTTIPLIDTHNVTNMKEMFSNCSDLANIPLLDTSKVTDMSNMFNECYNLTTIPLLDTHNVTDMARMFYGCTSLTTIPLIDTSKVTDMASMFNRCSSLTTIPLIDTSKVTDMASMFNRCSSLTTIPLLDTRSAVDISNMFNGCYSLTLIPKLNFESAIKADKLFANCSSLTCITDININHVTSAEEMFLNCSLLQNLPENMLLSSVSSLRGIFKNCSSLVECPRILSRSCTDLSYIFYGCTNLKSVETLDKSYAVSMDFAFYGCRNLEEVMSKYDTTSFKSLSGPVNNLFTGCYSLSGTINFSKATGVTDFPSNNFDKTIFPITLKYPASSQAFNETFPSNVTKVPV